MEGMEVLFVWTSKAPTPEQIKKAQEYIQDKFTRDFEFPQYPPSEADLKLATNCRVTDFEGFPKFFEGDVRDLKKVMEFLDGLGVGSRVNVSEHTYDGYIKPPYSVYSRLGEVDTGIADAKAQIQKGLDLLPARDRKYILSTLGK